MKIEWRSKPCGNGSRVRIKVVVTARDANSIFAIRLPMAATSTEFWKGIAQLRSMVKVRLAAAGYRL